MICGRGETVKNTGNLPDRGTMNHFLPHRTVYLALAFSFPGVAQADALQDKLLAGIRAARADAYTFERTIVFERTGAGRKVFVERFDPRRPPKESWSLISVDGHAPTAKELAQSRKSKHGPVPSYGELATWLGAPATRSDTVSGYVTYRYASLPAGTFRVGSHDASADTRAEALVNAKGPTPFVERIRFVSDKAFRMMMVASVQSMDVTNRYRVLATGKVVPETSASVMAGSMLGKSGQMRTTVSYDRMQVAK
jgi:hypothetical protein